jgi:hypothetical protein
LGTNNIVSERKRNPLPKITHCKIITLPHVAKYNANYNLHDGITEIAAWQWPTDHRLRNSGTAYIKSF